MKYFHSLYIINSSQEPTKKGCDSMFNVMDAAPCYTFLSFRSKLHLDYIFVSQDIHVASVEVIEKITSASDHLPLKATLLFNG